MLCTIFKQQLLETVFVQKAKVCLYRHRRKWKPRLRRMSLEQRICEVCWILK